MDESYLNKAVAVSYVAVSLDILTDLLGMRCSYLSGALLMLIVVAIPICLLWKIQIRLNQKLGLGAFLCLSFAMIAVAAVRTAGIRQHHQHYQSVDVVWEDFWLVFEACTAVSTVSFTAFRSLFIWEASKAREKNARPPWYSVPREQVWNRQKRSADDISTLHFPTMPTATKTGLQTLIHGGPKTEASVDDDCATLHEGYRGHGSSEIRVTLHISSQSEHVGVCSQV